eukprot:960613-Pyramimonas_sp.AAC.1
MVCRVLSPYRGTPGPDGDCDWWVGVARSVSEVPLRTLVRDREVHRDHVQGAGCHHPHGNILQPAQQHLRGSRPERFPK